MTFFVIKINLFTLDSLWFDEKFKLYIRHLGYQI